VATKCDEYFINICFILGELSKLEDAHYNYFLNKNCGKIRWID